MSSDRHEHRGLLISGNSSKPTITHTQLFDAGLVQEDPVTEQLELCRLQEGWEVEQWRMQNLIQCWDVCILLLALVVISLFDIFSNFLRSVSLLLLGEGVIFFNHHVPKAVGNLEPFSHQVSWRLLSHDAFMTELVDVNETIGCFHAVIQPTVRLRHDDFFVLGWHVNVRKSPPLILLSVKDERVIVTTLSCAIVNQDCMQIVWDVTVVFKGILHAVLELRNPVLDLLLSRKHGILVGLYHLNGSLLLISLNCYALQVLPRIGIHKVLWLFHGAGALTNQELFCLLEMFKCVIVLTSCILLPQLLDLLLHSLSFLKNTFDPANISFEILIDEDFLIEFKSTKRFFGLLRFLVILHTIETEY